MPTMKGNDQMVDSPGIEVSPWQNFCYKFIAAKLPLSESI